MYRPSAFRNTARLGLLSCLLGGAFIAPVATAQTGTIQACVNKASGIMRIVPDGTRCHKGWQPLQLNTGADTAPTPAPAPAPSTAPTIQYITQGMVPDTSVARAFCPAGSRVTGGGGISLNGAGLQQSYPISDTSGVIAWDSHAIGWQVAASDWSDVQAFVICISP